jgi:hypothetical protein
MKTLLFITCLLISSVQVYSQQAGDYFPPITDFTYPVYPLDSANQQVISEVFRRRDLFVDVTEYEGKLANIFLTKDAPMDSINIFPYLDSLFLHFDGTDGYEYFQTRPLEDFLRSIDSLNLDPNFSFLDFFTSLQAWYSVYRFSATVNDEYTLLTVDTLIAGVGFTFRFEYLGERFPDETINTLSHGSFDCKKFLISWKASVNFGVWIEILSTKDTVWIAEPDDEFWVAQDIVPSNYIDLSFIGIPPFWILGQSTQPPIIVSAEDEEFIPLELALEQNYPNPFNPTTSIQYTISNMQFVSLKVYDILGNEVATLVNSEKPAGVYVVEWNAANLPSGVYFYQLKTGSFVQTKKMLLLK